MSVPPSILALASRTPEFAATLERWANVNSGSSHGAGLTRMRETLRGDFVRAFPHAFVEEIPAEAPGFNPAGAASLSIRLRPAAPLQVVLCGHFDTVYEAGSPFQVCRWLDATTVNGPGVGDMKGGILTLLAALQAFEQTAGREQLGWEVLLTPDEEIGSHGSLPLLREAAKRHNFGLVFEPARPSGDIVKSRKGTGTFKAICRGRASHAAKVPNDGRNAVLALSEALLEIARVPAQVPGVLVSVANMRGGSPVTNIVPDYAEAEIDVRVTTTPERDALLARFRAIADTVNQREGFRFEWQGGFNRPPKECNAAEEAVFAGWQAAANDLGVPSFTWVHTGGASDGNFLTEAGLANLDGLGPVADRLHSEDEFCRVDTIAPRAQLAALVLHRMALGEIALPPRSAHAP